MRIVLLAAVAALLVVAQGAPTSKQHEPDEDLQVISNVFSPNVD